MKLTIANDVYLYLKEQRKEIKKLVEQKTALEERRNSGNYGQDYVQNHIVPAIGEIRFQIARKKDLALVEVRSMVDKEKAAIKELNVIRGEDLTEDAKLFNCGVKLTEKDIDRIIQRNRDNYTMVQLAIKYAKDNGIQVNHVVDNHSHELDMCENQYETASLYLDHWVDNVQGDTILNKFYGVSEEGN